MIFRKRALACVCLLIYLNLINFSWAEPLIVLEFSNQNQFSEGDGVNLFSIDPDYSTYYNVQSGDSVSSILQNFYKGSGLDWRFVQLSIVIANPKAFANKNPNFLFSDTKIYLPGKTDILKLLTGKKIKFQNSDETNQLSTQNIYFFGG